MNLRGLPRHRPVTAEEQQRTRAVLEEEFPPTADVNNWPSLQTVVSTHDLDLDLARWILRDVLADQADA